MRPWLLTIAVSFVGILTTNAMAADPAAWIPADVNAVARINVAEIYKTPLAQKEGWLKKATESFVQQEAFVPPGTKQIMVGAELDLSDNLMARRKFAVVVPDAQMTLESLSAWLPGDLEKLSGKTLARFGNDGFVADAGDGCWLTSGSANRQVITRWLRNGPTPEGNQLSRYLRSALKSKENTAQLMLAIDLQDSFSRQSIAENLKATDWFKSETTAESATKILESVQGITIGITVGSERKGTATVDFEKDAEALKLVIDKLVAAVIDRVGVSGEDIQGWKWYIKGSQLTGSGPVSSGGVRRLLSVLDPPAITQAISAKSAAAATTDENPMAKTSLKYCKSLQVLLNDLRVELHSATYNYALYFERYARKIDDLPTLHVDGALLDFAGKVSSSLRYQAQVQRMSNVSAGTRTAQTYSGGYVGAYGWSAPVGVGAGIAINAAANESAKSVRFSETKQIEDGLVSVRRSMTEKYQIQF